MGTRGRRQGNAMSIEQVKAEWQKMLKEFSCVESVEVTVIFDVTTRVTPVAKVELYAIYDKELELMDKFPDFVMGFHVRVTQ